MIRILAICLTISLMLTAVSCHDESVGGWQGWDSYGTPGTWPVGRVVDEPQFGSISIYPAAGETWHGLVDLEILKGFWPGMTGKDAVRVMGQADRYLDLDGERYWVYERSDAHVVVAHKSKGSLIGGWWWRLEARFDPPRPPAELLHSSVVEELPDDLERYTVTIMNNEGSPAAWAYIEDGRVARIDISPHGAKGAVLGGSGRPISSPASPRRPSPVSAQPAGTP